jgi:hypothetical protein
MPKHMLFLIHGMGKHGTPWAEDAAGPATTLAALSARYAHFAERIPLADLVEVVPVRYDEVFREAIGRWRGEAGAAANAAAYDPGEVLTSVLSGFQDASEESFWWSHVADAVMYRCLGWYRQRVRTHVIAQIAERIEQAWAADGTARCSVVAHSLGTAVAHDSVHLLGTHRWGHAANPFHPSHWRFQHLVMLANTSRLLQLPDDQVPTAYSSIVRPGPVEDPKSYCASYWNVRHDHDLVAVPRQFAPVGWRKEFSTLVVDHYHDANIHGFSHYLVNPRVHVPLLRRLTKTSAITPQEEVAAVDAFQRFRIPQLEKARAHLKQLQALALDLPDAPDAQSIAHALVRVLALAQRFRR